MQGVNTKITVKHIENIENFFWSWENLVCKFFYNIIIEQIYADVNIAVANRIPFFEYEQYTLFVFVQLDNPPSFMLS